MFYKIDFNSKDLMAQRISRHNYYSRVCYYNTHDSEYVFNDGTSATIAWDNNTLFIEGSVLDEKNFEELREAYRYYAA